MSDAVTTSKEDWERFFHLDNQDSLLDSVSPVHSKLPTGDFDTSPSVPSLDFTLNSAGTSSPSEPDNFASQFSPIYQISGHAPSTTPTLKAPHAKKRKLATETAAAAAQPASMGRQPRGQKISHNVIEKRYRSNLNDKIAKLRDSVPELRTATPTVKRRGAKASSSSGAGAGSDSDGSGGDDGGQGLKFNKATVLTKATEYIQQLERQNQKLASELSQIRNRAGPIEKLRNPPAISTSLSIDRNGGPSAVPEVIVTSGDKASDAASAIGMLRVPDEVRRLRDEASPGDHYAPAVTGFNPDDENELSAFNQPVKGMIGLPDDMRRLREQAAAQDHFAPESSYYSSHALSNQEETAVDEEDEGESNTWSRSKVLSRVLVGSLAGLMVMEGLAEPDGSSQKDEKRGLFSLPTDLVTESRGFRAQIRQRIINFALSPPAASKLLPLFVLSAVFFAVCFGVFVWLAPKESKAEREGPLEQTDRYSIITDGSSPDSLSPPQSGRPWTPPPNTPFEPASGSWDFELIDRLSTKWFGTSWHPAQRADEESSWRRPRGRLWADLRERLPNLLYDRRPK